MGVGEEGYGPLFESKGAKGRVVYKLYAVSILVGVCMIWVYRATHIPKVGEEGRWAWMGLFGAELWFGFYWILTQSLRWNPIYNYTFKDRLTQRFEKQLPNVDIFVLTADPTIEPPLLVINTVLSVMAYDYPSEKLAVYLSDDAGSEITFYALLEASHFSRHWIPYCKRFKVEPRSPAKYFSSTSHVESVQNTKEFITIKKLYKEMEHRIETIIMEGRISEEVRKQHKGFCEWISRTTPNDHPSIVQILIDGREYFAADVKGNALPTLVYLAREKRPQHPHNFKAGAMNALIRVSSEISNGPIILNVDCDMYSNNSESMRDALCFFMDEEKGHDIGYVQFPQNFNNFTKNNIYGDYISVINEVELPGYNGHGGPFYMGTGCFHRRGCLYGNKYSKDCKEEWKIRLESNVEESTSALEERAKGLAISTYEQNTQWGKEMGLKYGCLVEDVITGLSIQCKGWRSIYFNPSRKGFLGISPTTLPQIMLQYKRWSEGLLQIFLSKYCPFLYGHGKIKVGLQMAYSTHCLWAANSLPTLYYVIIPSLCLLEGIPLYPKTTSLWFIPFGYVIVSKYMYCLVESLWCGETLKGWWNMQRMWMMRRAVGYLFSFIGTIIKLLGFAKLAFIVTAKVSDDEILARYEQEVMEFGSPSPMLTILAKLALLNLLCLVVGVKRLVVGEGTILIEQMFLQFILCGLLVVINIPIYQAVFFSGDKGRRLTLRICGLVILATLACLIPMI